MRGVSASDDVHESPIEQEEDQYELSKIIVPKKQPKGSKTERYKSKPKVQYDRALDTNNIDLQQLEIKAKMKEPSVGEVSIESLKKIP